MRCALITLVHGRHGHLRLQREGLRGSSRAADDYVVVVMDDPRLALDDDARLADCLGAGEPHARLLQVDRDRGHLPLARARNAGAEEALSLGAELLIFLDVDCIPSPRLIERYQQAALGRASALLCGPVGYLPPPPAGGYDLHDLAAAGARSHPARPVPGEQEMLEVTDMRLFWSLSFAIGAESWRRTGGFCGDYRGYGGEDTDFAQLAARAGLRMFFVGGAWAYHQHHSSEDPPLEHLAEIVENANLFHRRWGWWPMEGWLSEFERRGLVRFDRAGEEWRLLEGSDSRPHQLEPEVSLGP